MQWIARILPAVVSCWAIKLCVFCFCQTTSGWQIDADWQQVLANDKTLLLSEYAGRPQAQNVQVFLETGASDRVESEWIDKIASTKRLRLPFVRVMTEHFRGEDLSPSDQQQIYSAVMKIYVAAEQDRDQIELYVKEIGLLTPQYFDEIEALRASIEKTKLALRLSRARIVDESAAKTHVFLTDVSEDTLLSPVSLAESEREVMIRQRIAHAIELLNNQQIVDFYLEVVDPVQIANEIVTTGRPFEQSVRNLALRSIDPNDRHYAAELLKGLRRQRRASLHWHYDGRITSLEGSRIGCWVWRENQFYLCLFEVNETGWRVESGDNDAVAMDFFGNDDELLPPDLKGMDEEQRLASLRHAQDEYLKVMETGDSRKIVERFWDPVLIAELALSTTSGMSIKETADWICKQTEVEKVEGRRQEEIEVVRAQRLEAPVWYLNGRFAGFPQSVKNSSVPSIVWIFYEGRWRVNRSP